MATRLLWIPWWPGRFLERHYSPFEFLPFGGGIRRCIGMAFAQFEMKLVLSSILARFILRGPMPAPCARRVGAWSRDLLHPDDHQKASLA